MVNTAPAMQTNGGASMDRASTLPPGPLLWVVLANAADFLESDPETAETQAREILKSIPAQQHALTLLVSARKAMGDMAGACAILESISAEYPGIAAVRHELGALLLEMGEPEAAICALSRVVELEPKHPAAWRLLAEAFADVGDTQAAANAYLKHFESSVMDLKMLERAVALDIEQAETTENMLREFLTLHPTDITAAHMLGKLCKKLNLLEDAERLFARVVELAPDYASGTADYLDVLQLQSKWEKELEVLNRVLERSPDDPGNLFRKSAVLSRLGEHRESLHLYEYLVGEYPDEPRCWSGLANELRTLGRREASVAAQRRSIELDPGHGQGWWGLATFKTYRFSSADMDAMQAQLQREDLAQEPRYYLQFALGEALEREGRFSESFKHYVMANALRQHELPYDADETTANVQRIKKQYTRDFFRRHGGMGSPSAEPIFIVGLPRSGSTLVEQILSCHSAIEAAGELPCLVPVVLGCNAVETDENADATLTFDASVLRSAGEQYLDRSRSFRKFRRLFFTDKTPGNFHHLGLVCAILPNARIIDVRRHPLACCFSNFRQLFPSGLPQTCGLTDIGRYYHDYVDMMAHFDEVLPGRIHRVFYEELVRDHEAQVRALLAYCGIPFEKSCLHSHRSDRAILTISSEQVRLPLYPGANEQWRNYEPWLSPLKTALGPVLDAYPAVPNGLDR